MFKTSIFYTFVTVLLILVLSLGYFILVNTVLADNILPNLKLNSKDVSLLSKEDLDTKIYSEALSVLPEFLEVEIDDRNYKVATSTLDLELQSYNILNYGKGNDFFKVIREALDAVTGNINVELYFSADVNNFLFNSPIKYDSSVFSKVENSKYECIDNHYKFELDSNYILNKLNEGLRSEKVVLSSESIALQERDKQIFRACKKYFSEIDILTEELAQYTDNKITDYIGLYEESGPVWKFLDGAKQSQLLEKISRQTDVEPKEGSYEFVGSKIYLYENYQTGVSLNKVETKVKLESFLANPSQGFDVVTKEKKPAILSSDVEIVDFTKMIGEGKSRIDLVRNGASNYIVAYTQYGLEEIDYHVVNPGEEFSYIDFIQPNNGRTKSGRPIAPGICNATTTLFRAVLESGLDVTDRSYHAYYVPSYEWGYPYNIVDAAYFTDPDVDFKFRNDSEFPILLRVEFKRDEDFQYNTVKILSSSKSKDKEVELTNWNIWDKYSNTNFKGSFDRIVKIDGEIVKKDYFYSHYL